MPRPTSPKRQPDNADAAAAYYSAGALDPEATSASLARLRAPVLLVVGEYDVALPPKCAAEYAGLFPQAELAVQPGGGHYPWLDDPEWLVQTLGGVLALTDQRKGRRFRRQMIEQARLIMAWWVSARRS